MIRRWLVWLLLVASPVWAASPTSLDILWTAPTTSADGTPLTDLAGYRLYLEAPCPSLQYATVSAPTSAPGPDETVATTVTGLMPSTTYTARVTAVDDSGNESPCSSPATGMTLAASPPPPAGLPVVTFAPEAASSMTQTDNFNRADETPLASPWAQIGSLQPWNLAGNVAVPSSTSASTGMVYDTGTFSDNQYAQAKVSVSGTTAGTGVGVLVRSNSASIDFYGARVNKAGANNLVIMKRVGGAQTELASFTVTWVDGDVLRLDVNDTTLTVKQNGATIGSTTDSDVASGRPGLTSDDPITAGSADDWDGNDLAGTSILRQMMMHHGG